MNNHYSIMRHGQSLANVGGLIVSHPENGLNSYGLSDKGRQQVSEGIQASDLDAGIHLFSSDFKRARETAEIVHQTLNCDHEIMFDERLRERHFGDFELKPDTHYPEVWAMDKRDLGHSEHNVETVQSVLQRSMAVVNDFEKHFDNETCLLIAHGDILQILQTAFYQIPPHQHRELPHLETAEVRALRPKNGHSEMLQSANQ